MTVELRIPIFEDEHWTINNEIVDNFLIYHNVCIRDFVSNIISLIEKYEQDYNEGFVLSPSNRLNKRLLKQVKGIYKYLIRRKRI